MNPFRCSNCKKLLAKVHSTYTTIPAHIVPHTGEITEIDKDHSKVEIKCPYCNTMNEIAV